MYAFTFMSLISGHRAFAQTSARISQNAAYYSNSFYNYNQLPDIYNNIGINIQHIVIHEVVQSRFYYDGNVSMFKEFSDRFNHYHEIGYDGIISYSKNNHTFYFGSSLGRNLDKGYYTLYDNRKIDFYSNFKYYLRENLIARSGYVYTNRIYDNLSEFTYGEHQLFVRLNTYFQSGTSLSFYLNYGLKNYKQTNPDNVVHPSTDQLILYAKTAQSLGAKTSISFSYLNRSKPGFAQGQTNVINNEYLFSGDELFDDRYGYSGHELMINLIYYLPHNIKSEFNIGTIWKNYHNRLIFDEYGDVIMNEGTTRHDFRYSGWLSISRGFMVGRLIQSANAYLTVGYLKNHSNDVYYDFNNIYTSIGIEFKIE